VTLVSMNWAGRVRTLQYTGRSRKRNKTNNNDTSEFV